MPKPDKADLIEQMLSANRAAGVAAGAARPSTATDDDVQHLLDTCIPVVALEELCDACAEYDQAYDKRQDLQAPAFKVVDAARDLVAASRPPTEPLDVWARRLAHATAELPESPVEFVDGAAGPTVIVNRRQRPDFFVEDDSPEPEVASRPRPQEGHEHIWQVIARCVTCQHERDATIDEALGLAASPPPQEPDATRLAALDRVVADIRRQNPPGKMSSIGMNWNLLADDMEYLLTLVRAGRSRPPADPESAK